MPSILAIPGSLRANSSSYTILRALAEMAPAGTTVEIYGGMGTLPHFNDAEDPSETVLDFRKKIKDADAVLICTPEYAFGVPGSLKNALDWTVSSGEFIDKPVGLVTASSQGEKGHAALLLILSAISSRVIPEATLLISYIRAKLDASGNIKDAGLKETLRGAIGALVDSIITHK